MKLARLISLLVIAAFVGSVACVQAQTPAARPERTYRNPAIDRIRPADPHVIRHEGRYDRGTFQPQIA